MEQYEINHIIMDDEFTGEETVTAEFSQDGKQYSITFIKSDLEVINSWIFIGTTTLPANLSKDTIESIRKDIKERI